MVPARRRRLPDPHYDVNGGFVDVLLSLVFRRRAAFHPTHSVAWTSTHRFSNCDKSSRLARLGETVDACGAAQSCVHFAAHFRRSLQMRSRTASLRHPHKQLNKRPHPAALHLGIHLLSLSLRNLSVYLQCFPGWFCL